MTGQTVREVSTGVSVKAFGGFRIERKVVIVIGLGDGVDKWELHGGEGRSGVCRCCGPAARGLGRNVDSARPRLEDPQVGVFHTQSPGSQLGTEKILSTNDPQVGMTALSHENGQ